jgi:uncharacterized damage-inducible protein DinB
MKNYLAAAEINRRPNSDEYAEYYHNYIRRIPDHQCLEMLESQIDELQEFFRDVTEVQASTVHAPYTWTIKQVVGHLIDGERVFADRLLRFSSGEQQAQPGFDQDAYVSQQDYATPQLRSLVDELLHCRQANLLLIRRLKPTAFDQRGLASGYECTVRALVWMMVGHICHHMNILRLRLVKG